MRPFLFRKGVHAGEALATAEHVPDNHHRDDQQHGKDRAPADAVHFHQLACTPRLRTKLPNALMAASAEAAIGIQTCQLTW
jgi:hypothetical protein